MPVSVYQRITDFFNKTTQFQYQPPFPPNPQAGNGGGNLRPATTVVHHHHSNPVIINNGTHCPPPNPKSCSSSKSSNDKLTPLEIVGLAVVGTGVGIAIAYFSQENTTVTEMKDLLKTCEHKLEKFTKDPLNSNPTSAVKREILAYTVQFLRQEISFATQSKNTKLVSVSSFGVVVAGSILTGGFLTSVLGLVSLGTGCGSLIWMANNYFTQQSSRPRTNELIGTIRQHLQSLVLLEENQQMVESQVYPSAPPAYAYESPKEPPTQQ